MSFLPQFAQQQHNPQLNARTMSSSFVGRLFSSSPSSTATPTPASSPPTPSRTNGSILRSSTNGQLANGKRSQHRVSFSHDHLKSNGNNNCSNQNNGNAVKSSVISPQNGTVNSANTNSSWFRSFFSSSSAKSTSTAAKIPNFRSSTPDRQVSITSEASITSNGINSIHSSTSSFASINSEEATEFKPESNVELLDGIPLELTKGINGDQLRLTAERIAEPEAALDVTESAEFVTSASLDDSAKSILSSLSDIPMPPPAGQVLVQNVPFRLDARRVGLILLNKDGICGYNNIARSSAMELSLKKLLVENIMEELPKPRTPTNPLLRARAEPPPPPPDLLLPSSVTLPLSPESRLRTDKSHVRGVNLNQLEMSVFYNTLAEMIFGSMQLIAQKPAPKSMLDLEYNSGAKVFAFKLHHLGTVWEEDDDDPNGSNQAEDLFITSFIIDLEKAHSKAHQTGLPIQCGVAVLWLCPQSSPIFSNVPAVDHTSVTSELTMYNLLFNTPTLLKRTLQAFAADIMTLGINNIRFCFSRMLHQLSEFMNGIRLRQMEESEAIDALVDLIKRYDNKEHCFFISNLLSTIFTFAYKQDGFKVVLWSSQLSQVPMMAQIATMINQFLSKSVHQISDEMVISDSYKFVIPKSLRTDFETADTEQAGEAVIELCESGEPVLSTSSSSTVSTITAIQVKAVICCNESNSMNQMANSGKLCFKSDRKSRDESIGYESLTESATSISPVNEPDDETDGDGSGGGSGYTGRNGNNLDNLLLFQQNLKETETMQNDAMRALLNVSQTTDYEEDGPMLHRSDTNTTTTTTTSSDDTESEYLRSKSSANLNKRQSYFRGYVDMRYKDQQQQQQQDGQAEQEPYQSRSSSTVLLQSSSQGSSPTNAVSSLITIQSNNNNQSDLNGAQSSTSASSQNVSQINLEAPESQDHPPANIPVVEMTKTPFKMVTLKGIPGQAGSTWKPPELRSDLSPAASSLYHYSWLSLPVITCHHLDLVTTQVIIGETIEQAKERGRYFNRDQHPESYDYLYNKLSQQLRDEQNNDTIFLIDCDNWTMNLLERALNEPCGPVMSTFIANACERIISLATIENRKYDIWEYLRYILTQMLLKSEVLQSTLENDLHLLMVNRSVKKLVEGKDVLDIYIHNEVKIYARKVWNELIGDPNVGVYLTCDGPKANFDLFRFRPPTSALYLFSDNNLSHFYLPSPITTRLLDFDSSDVPVIVGMRKQFLRSRKPLINQIHGKENTKMLDYLLKKPNFPKRDNSQQPYRRRFLSMHPGQVQCTVKYKTIAFNMLIAGLMPKRKRYQPKIATTSLSVIPESKPENTK